jgi:hypothetical protein
MVDLGTPTVVAETQSAKTEENDGAAEKGPVDTRANLIGSAVNSCALGLLQGVISGDEGASREDGDPTRNDTDAASLLTKDGLKVSGNNIVMKKAFKDADKIREAVQVIILTQQLEDNQADLARISNLLPNAYLLAKENRLQNVALAVASLSSKQPNNTFAAAVISDCELSILRSQRGLFRIVYSLAGSTSVSATLSGLIFSALGMLSVAGVITIMVILLKDKLGSLPGQFQLKWNLIFLMVIMAASGSFVSVLSRLNQFSTNRGFDAFLVFFTGFFKPWIGVVFGVFLFFVLESHMINLSTISDKADGSIKSIYVVLGFIGGFSERLVSDFIGRTEVRILGADGGTTTQVTSQKVNITG